MKEIQYKISAKSLMEELEILIKDEIVATYSQKEEAIEVNFSNGQKFLIDVREIK